MHNLQGIHTVRPGILEMMKLEQVVNFSQVFIMETVVGFIINMA